MESDSDVDEAVQPQLQQLAQEQDQELQEGQDAQGLEHPAAPAELLNSGSGSLAPLGGAAPGHHHQQQQPQYAPMPPIPLGGLPFPPRGQLPQLGLALSPAAAADSLRLMQTLRILHPEQFLQPPQQPPQQQAPRPLQPLFHHDWAQFRHVVIGAGGAVAPAQQLAAPDASLLPIQQVGVVPPEAQTAAAAAAAVSARAITPAPQASGSPSSGDLLAPQQSAPTSGLAGLVLFGAGDSDASGGAGSGSVPPLAQASLAQASLAQALQALLPNPTELYRDPQEQVRSGAADVAAFSLGMSSVDGGGGGGGSRNNSTAFSAASDHSVIGAEGDAGGLRAMRAVPLAFRAAAGAAVPGARAMGLDDQRVQPAQALGLQTDMDTSSSPSDSPTEGQAAVSAAAAAASAGMQGAVPMDVPVGVAVAPRDALLGVMGLDGSPPDAHAGAARYLPSTVGLPGGEAVISLSISAVAPFQVEPPFLPPPRQQAEGRLPSRPSDGVYTLEGVGPSGSIPSPSVGSRGQEFEDVAAAMHAGGFAAAAAMAAQQLHARSAIARRARSIGGRGSLYAGSGGGSATVPGGANPPAADAAGPWHHSEGGGFGGWRRAADAGLVGRHSLSTGVPTSPSPDASPRVTLHGEAAEGQGPLLGTRGSRKRLATDGHEKSRGGEQDPEL